MMAIRDIPDDIWTLAFGCFRGDKCTVHGVFRVAFEGASLRTAAREVGVNYLALRRDRQIFQKVLKEYKKQRQEPTDVIRN